MCTRIELIKFVLRLRKVYCADQTTDNFEVCMALLYIPSGQFGNFQSQQRIARPSGLPIKRDDRAALTGGHL